MKTFVIAEAGVNHNGREDLALELVDTAARCGADAVKFQTFSADRLVRPGADKAEYQKLKTEDGDQHAMLKSLEMSDELHRKLYDRCTELGIEFMSTPFDDEAAAFLVELGVKRFKVPSGEITNKTFLAHLAGYDLPIILSTGMADMAEVLQAAEIVGQARRDAGHEGALEDKLTILHCTSNYPAASRDVNLRAMQSIATETGLPVGYSDHTLGVAVATAAVALGACVIEKHFTLDQNMEGPDHQASLMPDELASMINQIRQVEEALGSPIKQPSASELPIRALVRRSITTVRALRAGDRISEGDIALLRPGNGIPPTEYDCVIGKILSRDVEAGSTLQWTDFR